MREMTIRTESGFTILEVLIAAAISAVVIGVAVGALYMGSKASNYGNAYSDLEQDARRAMGWMTRELRQSGVENSVDMNGTLILRLYYLQWSGFPVPTHPNCAYFRISNGYDNATDTIIWSPFRIFYFRYEPAEYFGVQGKDDDGDGVVDEGEIIFNDYSRNIWRPIATNVKDTFRITRNAAGNELTIYLPLERRMADGTVVSYELTDKVHLKN